MRVIRRDALPHLQALPNGLHFTPAMSARAIMSDLRIVEVPMPYSERVGESKLHVLRDGVRFLLAIGDALLLYRPSRLFTLLAGLCVLTGWFWVAYPVEFYLGNRRLEEWMIYRLLLCGFVFTTAFILVSAGVLVENMLSLVYRRKRETFWGTLTASLFSGGKLYVAAALCVMAALLLVRPGLVEYAQSGHVTLHWSRPLVAVFLLQISLLSVIHGVMQKVINLWKGQLQAGVESQPLA
jgi:hypothetical protein